MPETDQTKIATTGMTPDYAGHDTYQQAVEAAAEPLVLQAARRVAAATSGTFVIVDYGCATNPHSATLFRIIEATPISGPAREIAVVHNDLPANNWNALVQAATDPRTGYVSKARPPVLCMMAAGSFFTPVVPNAEAHLGISFSAAHWLREQPSLAAGSWCFCDAREPERAILAELAAEDWRVFLSARAHELVSGGALIVTMIGTAEKSGVTAHELVQFLRDTAQEFVDEGRLERSVFEQFVFPTYARSVDEAQAPFLPGGALAPYFEVETADVVPVANPYLPLLQRGETAKYIDSYVGFVRAFTAATLLAHVFGPGGRQEKPDVLLEAYYDRLRERLAQNPERGVFKDWTLRIVANRR